jgi:tetratricopeptide (TPR) repeat protein
MGCAVADYDNDGDPDLYLTAWGPNALYRNEGNSTFSDVTREAGVGDPRWGTSAAFGDLDGDGSLDLYVANYVAFDLNDPPGGGRPCTGWKGLSVFCGPHGMEADSDVLYRNRGDGTFADLSQAAGVARFRYPALGVVFLDCDGDGDQDIYVANDSTPNLLFRNDGHWRLSEVGALAGVGYSEEGKAQAGMGVDAGDYDNDGDLDLLVTNFSDDVNTLYQNQGDGTFADATYGAGLGGEARPYLGWSTALADFDSDGWLDLFVANGHLYPQLEAHPLGLRYPQRNLLYWNQGGIFRLAHEAGEALEVARVSRGAAFGDMDNDGDLDLAVVNLNDRAELLRNDGGNRHNWLGLDLVAAQGSQATGTLVRMVSGDQVLMRPAKRNYGYLSSSDGRVLFGLGERERADRVEIRWPSGQVQVLERPQTRRYWLVRQGQEPVVAAYSRTGEDLLPPAAPLAAARQQSLPPAPPVQLPAQLPPEWSAAVCYARVTDLYRQGRYQEALHLGQLALGRYSEDARLHYALAVILYSGLGRSQEAAEILEQALALGSSLPEVAQLLGVAYLSLNQPDRAVPALERAASLAPDNWEIPYRLGLARNRQGQAKAAIAAFEQAIALAPEEPMPYLHLARTSEQLGLRQMALEAQRRFAELKPLQEEIERYRQAVAANPDHPAAHNGLALALALAGRLQEARAQLEQALALDSQYAQTHANLASVLQRLGEISSAIEHYRRAIQLDPNLAEAHYGLGMALYAVGRSTEALQALERALALRPDYVMAHINRGVLLDEENRLEEAIAHFRRAVALAPDDARAANNLVIALARAGQVEKAQEELQQAQARRVDLPLARKTLVRVLVALAQAHAEKGEVHQAIARQRQAIALTPASLQSQLFEALRVYEGRL